MERLVASARQGMHDIIVMTERVVGPLGAAPLWGSGQAAAAALRVALRAALRGGGAAGAGGWLDFGP